MRSLRLIHDRSLLAALVLIGLVFLGTMLTPVEFALWAFYLAPIFLVYVFLQRWIVDQATQSAFK